MKKYFLAIGLVAFLMTSCCDKKENTENKECCKDKKEQCDHKHAPCPEMMAQIDLMINALANWDDLDETQHADLIEMAKTHVEKTAAMKAEMEKCCKEKPECCKDGKNEGCKHEGKCQHEEKCQHKGNCDHNK